MREERGTKNTSESKRERGIEREINNETAAERVHDAVYFVRSSTMKL